MKAKAILMLAAAGLLVAGTAEAGPGHRGRPQHFSGHHHYRPHFVSRVVVVATPLYAIPRYYYAPAPVVYAPPPQPVYIEQQPAVVEQPQPSSQAWWYYCPSSGAYYPQVQSCATGWQRVAPQPPPN